ncbi:hypothetical protein A3780_19045 [Kosakonia radicincitans]|nr:hypothetical protein A3780_19045 [Kosakonia radicincitans]KDE35732.1 hypothetical protein AW40_15550 [Kosakonia radicincitans UMEnt01/12]
MGGLSLCKGGGFISPSVAALTEKVQTIKAVANNVFVNSLMLFSTFWLKKLHQRENSPPTRRECERVSQERKIARQHRDVIAKSGVVAGVCITCVTLLASQTVVSVA